jgi:hypothetical protein
VQANPSAGGPEVDIGATKLIARYRTLKRDLPECRLIEGPILNAIRSSLEIVRFAAQAFRSD